MDESHLRYRPEIDGLRAVAVLAVILFHAEVPKMQGGFVGVDIFYVISGYLITKIIVSQLQRNDFSFIIFYERRIKRLFPAAFFLIFSTVLFGSLLLAPDKYIELAKSAIYSSAFLANVWFAEHSGYFDQAAEISPLVHMWSLAVEEQFYLLFPVSLYVVYKCWNLRGVRAFLAAMFFISLSLSFVLSSRYPNSSFYLLHTRAWELSLGGLLVLFPVLDQRNRFAINLVSVIGIAFTVIAILFMSKGVPYPGHWALLPTLGAAALIISSHLPGSMGNTLLTHKSLVFIGKFSYSAYLWHWPIIVYYRIYIGERHFSVVEALLLLLFSLLLGYLSWFFIEEKFRYRKSPSNTVFGSAFVASGLLVLISLSICWSDGVSQRFSTDVHSYTDKRVMSQLSCVEKIEVAPELPKKFCVVGQNWETAKNKGAIWGDSHLNRPGFVGGYFS